MLAEHDLIDSEPILTELERVLTDKLRMPPAQAGDVAELLRNVGEHVDPTEPTDWPEQNPDDRWIVATAVAGKAQVLVSGDRILLEHAADAPFPIFSPRGFWERLR